DFFESAGIPGFSLRSYPGSLNLMEGDTIRFFGFGSPLLLPEGQSVQEFVEDEFTFTNDEWFLLQEDPDDGADATKFNTLFFGGTCGDSLANACEWGADSEPVLPISNENGETWVTMTADAGSVLFGAVGPSSAIRVGVVSNPADASTAAELAGRAAALKAQDFNTAAGLHNKYRDRQTSHRDDQGRRVWDAWAGLSRGPVELIAMYPQKLNIKEGQRVQWHFDLENEVHNANFSFQQARDIFNNTFIPWCDPDGDANPGPDTEPDFTNPDDPTTWCADISQLEFDLDPREAFGGGNGTFNGNDSDFEGSGLRSRASLQDGFFSEEQWTVRFTKSSNRKGYRYFCTVHGTFMDGRVRVRG
ncbi:MAG: hypothetical protein ACRDJJ_04145, partial [Actinomycetota bacterium]